MAALEKKGIKNLEDLIDVVMPEPDETGGYSSFALGLSAGDPLQPSGGSSSEIDYTGAFGDYIVNMGTGFSNHLKELYGKGLH
ncbi:MAG: hypothetical protein O7C75_03290 [Verrucomicrobia bacterium]|nr:hypothetical protein [Verrucomicrobiota bacterium]